MEEKHTLKFLYSSSPCTANQHLGRSFLLEIIVNHIRFLIYLAIIYLPNVTIYSKNNSIYMVNLS